MLSVLVPTMDGRESVLSRLMFSLLNQPGLNTDFEVLCYRGPKPLGDKIGTMIDYALGSHVVVFDDDDWISARYMNQVLPLLGSNDSVGYDIAQMVDGVFEARVIHSFKEPGWTGEERGFCHKLPVRTGIAARYQFGNDYEDDRTWAANVETQLVTTAYVPEVLYYYDYRNAGPIHVGWWPHDPSQVRWL